MNLKQKVNSNFLFLQHIEGPLGKNIQKVALKKKVPYTRTISYIKTAVMAHSEEFKFQHVNLELTQLKHTTHKKRPQIR